MIVYFLFLIAAAFAGVAALFETITKRYRAMSAHSAPRFPPRVVHVVTDEQLDIEPALRRSK